MKDIGGESNEHAAFVAPEKIPEAASDIEVALFYIEHITNPCEVEVSPGQVENIRGFYIRLANEYLPKMTNPYAKKLLEEKIGEYL